MTNFREYLKRILPNIIITGFILSFFGLIFFISDYDLLVYQYSCLLILFVLLIVGIVGYLNFLKQENVKKQLHRCENKLKELESKSQTEKENLQEYFLMWVHQMKTPITACKLLVSDDNCDWEAQQILIQQELIYIEDYTEMAINYLKLVNISADFNFDKVVLDAIISKLFQKYRVLFIYNHIQLDYHKITDAVITDARWTSVMIEQILSNAIKYAKNKKITVKYDSKQATLTISDTGIGIKKEDLPKIFDKGYSGFNGRLEQKSSGLGLFLVREISNRLNQPVTVSSTYLQGSSFTIHFNR